MEFINVVFFKFPVVWFCVILTILPSSAKPLKATAVFTTTSSATKSLTNSTFIVSANVSIRSDIICSLAPTESELSDSISAMVAEGAKLLYYDIEIEGLNSTLSVEKASSIYKPLSWVRTTGRQGRGLLMLRFDYEILSLTTLGLGSRRLKVKLVQEPRNCLNKLDSSGVENALRTLALNDFAVSNTSSSSLAEEDHVCNMHVQDEGGYAVFVYTCCLFGSDKKIQCRDLKGDVWLNVLFMCIAVLKLLVILYGPKLVPDTWYRERYVACPYVHRLPADEPLKLKVVISKTPSDFASAKVVIRASRFKYMPKFREVIQRMIPDIIHVMSLKEVHLRIKSQRLLAKDAAPVGLLKALYDSFVLCKIRERESLAPCCYQPVCGPNCLLKRPKLWYKFLKEIMMVLFLTLVIIPWIVRVYVYFNYEHHEMMAQREAAARTGLSLPYSGEAALILTPVHLLFISIYIILVLDFLLFGVLRKSLKQRSKIVLRKCFRDMTEKSKSDVIGWAAALALKPCSAFGIYGVCIGALFWVIGLPFLLVVLAFYLFPTVNLTLRLVAHFALYSLPQGSCQSNNRICRAFRDMRKGAQERLDLGGVTRGERLERNEMVLNSARRRLIQLSVILVCLISLYSVIFLMTELVTFFVEIFVYTLMGIILNAATMMTYVSLLVLLAIYGKLCFRHVGKRYGAYNNTLNGLIVQLGKQKMEDIAYKPEDIQKNHAFRIKTERATFVEQPVVFEMSDEGNPRWKITKLMLFLSKKDNPLIPRRFYFDACKMDHYAAPGQLLMNYLHAASEFGLIILVLLFVLVVVLAFGDTYNISATNQLLATIAGGFIPFALKTFLFKQHGSVAVDTEDLTFQVCFNQILDKYVQRWPIFDIVVDSLEEGYIDAKNENTERVGRESGGSLEEKVGDVFKKDSHWMKENKPFIDSNATIETEHSISSDDAIDLVIDISNVDFRDFPGLQPATLFELGSMSLLGDIDESIKDNKSHRKVNKKQKYKV